MKENIKYKVLVEIYLYVKNDDYKILMKEEQKENHLQLERQLDLLGGDDLSLEGEKERIET